jgi:hypothetical protein
MLNVEVLNPRLTGWRAGKIKISNEKVFALKL